MKNLFLDIKTHLSHYFVLAFILAFGALAFLYFGYSPQIQLLSVFLTSIFYVLWGIFHHYLEGDLHFRIILEYVALALLGLLILISVINRT